MKTFTAYQSAVLRSVETKEKAMIYTRLRGFLTGTVTNIIADGWKGDVPFNVIAEDVVAYIQTLQK